MKIGIDFGSTYSLVSTFDNDTGNIKELQPDGRAAVTPSYLSTEDGEILFGDAAKNKVHDEHYKHFSGFKMMLAERKNDPRGSLILKKNGYDDHYTPRYVTKLYLREMLNGVLAENSEAGEVPDIADGFEHIFICVPELWVKNTKIDGCYALREILHEELKVKNVSIVMEPEAASAYFAYTYERNSGKKFNGHLFLIDFGGGTLDVTLSSVKTDNDGSIEIQTIHSDGKGENHEDIYGQTETGQAGIAFMQRLVQNVLNDNKVSNVDILSSEFKQTIVDVEALMKKPAHIKKIKSFFERFGDFKEMKKVFQPKYSDSSDEKNVLAQFRYNENKYAITFAQLYKTYQQVVEKELNDVIERMCDYTMQYIKRDPRLITSAIKDDFKVAIVGGFGSFYLVQKQIESIFNFDEMNDIRTQGLTVNENEKAISFGAALLAAGKVKLRKVAPYSLGVELISGNRRRLYYAIKFHQEIKKKEICYIHERGEKQNGTYNDVNNPKARFWGLKNIKQFVMGDNPDTNVGYSMALNPKYLRILASLPEGVWNLGFSIDDNYIITIHLFPAEGGEDGEGTQYRLSNFNEMFNLQMARRVTDGEEVQIT